MFVDIIVEFYDDLYVEEGIQNAEDQQMTLNVEKNLLELERLIHSLAKRDASDKQLNLKKRMKPKKPKERGRKQPKRKPRNRRRENKARRKHIRTKKKKKGNVKQSKKRRKNKNKVSSRRKKKNKEKDDIDGIKKNKRSKKRKKGKERKKINKSKKKKQRKKERKERRKQGKLENEKKNKEKDKTEIKEDDKPDTVNRQTCEECSLLLRDYSKLYRGKASVIPRQFKRINNFENLRSTKRSKRGNFASSYSSLLTALEDKSSPKCDGYSIADNSTQKEYVTALTTLENCDTDIDTSCPQLLTDAENATIISCNDHSQKFVSSMADCLNNTKYTTSSAICDCLKAISQDDVDALKQCDITQLSKDQKAEKNKCVKG